jgi:dihydrolipoamide dehydrogenase
MDYDVIIIGAGPAGYVAAIRSAQVGLKTALIEKKHIGGMCLNWGCIPTKAMIESAKVYHKMLNANKFGVEGIDKKKVNFNWNTATKRSDAIVKKLSGGIEYLLKKNGVDLIIGDALISSASSLAVNNRKLESKYIIIATGSYPQKIEADIPENLIIEIEDLWKKKELPENIVLIGTGPLSVEMLQFFHITGKKVSLITTSDDLIPGADDFIKKFIVKKLKSDKIKVFYSGKIQAYENGHLIVDKEKIKCDAIINCNWRKAIVPRSEIEIELDEQGFIKTGDFLETNEPGIYAIGDVNGRTYLAHLASAQGIWVINHIKGVRKELRLNTYPLNIYTFPEIAQVGQTEQELKEEGIDYKVSEFPLSANGKALTEGNTEGLLRMLSEKKYGQVLGVQIIADNATDMIAEASAFMQIEGTVFDVAQTIHAHPTVSEIFMEAGFDAIDKAIHK